MLRTRTSSRVPRGSRGTPRIFTPRERAATLAARALPVVSRPSLNSTTRRPPSESNAPTATSSARPISVSPAGTSTVRSRTGAVREASESSVAASLPKTTRPILASGALLSIARLMNASACATVSASMLLETSRANITSVCRGAPRSRGPARATTSAAIASPRRAAPAVRRKPVPSPRGRRSPHASKGSRRRSTSHEGCANSGTTDHLRLHAGLHMIRRAARERESSARPERGGPDQSTLRTCCN